MAAIADNITNVSTIGYKSAHVDFQTLVTKQASSTSYSPGGVQSRTRTGVDMQGLLQSAASETSIAVSGDGFFLVNDSAEPGSGDQFAFTRAGRFSPDENGNLRNSGGYYLQAWPTDAYGNVVLPRNSTAALANQNIISTEFLETVNLGRVGGTAAETSMISVGANLPATAAAGDRHNIDVEFFDTLGSSNAVTLQFSKAATNAWDLTVEPPSGTSVVHLYDDSGGVYASVGQLEFVGVPAAGESIFVGPTEYVFVNGATAAGDDQIQVDGGRSLSQIVGDLVAEINADGPGALASVKTGNGAVLVLTGDSAGVTVDPNQALDAGGAAAIRQSGTFNIQARTNTDPGVVFNSDGTPQQFNVATMAVLGFENGASPMDDTDIDLDGVVDVARIALNLGTANEADGLSQFGSEFSPTFIQQNGTKFGAYSGVSISNDGLVSALFDNGERRPIYRIPLVSFVNMNALQAGAANAWTATEASGSPVLREADRGAAGQIIQSSLEGSTVDIGEEFTNMIVVQRAYSAATRIISAADEMLEELVRTKR
jgi:flagellar hook protein FlgE